MELQKASKPIAALLLALCVCSCAWAAPRCSFPPSETGIGGTGTPQEGSGIGGTGMPFAGKVTLVQGKVEAQSGGQTRVLAAGDPVCVGETIATAAAALVQIRMLDDGIIAVRPETRLKIEKFAYAGAKDDTSLVALLTGAIRVVTGKLGRSHPENDLIRTPSGTIGVRGTDHEAMVILPHRGGKYAPGVYDRVSQGATYIRNGKGEVEIHPNQVGFAASTSKHPMLLERTPEFYHYDYPPLELKEAAPPEKTEGRTERGAGAAAEAAGLDHAGAAERPEIMDVSDEEDAINLPDAGELPDSLEHHDLH